MVGEAAEACDGVESGVGMMDAVVGVEGVEEGGVVAAVGDKDACGLVDGDALIHKREAFDDGDDEE